MHILSDLKSVEEEGNDDRHGQLLHAKVSKFDKRCVCLILSWLIQVVKEVHDPNRDRTPSKEVNEALEPSVDVVIVIEGEYFSVLEIK